MLHHLIVNLLHSLSQPQGELTMLRFIIEKITGEPLEPDARPLRLIATACAAGAVVYVVLALVLSL
jgi:hypothetical protein